MVANPLPFQSASAGLIMRIHPPNCVNPEPLMEIGRAWENARSKEIREKGALHPLPPSPFKAEELCLFNDISRKIIENLDLDSVLESIVEKAPLILQSDGSVLRLLNETGNLLEVVKKYNVGQAFSRALKPGEGVARFALEEGRVAIIPDISNDPYFLQKEDARKEGFFSAIVAPLRAKGRNLGTLTVHSRKPRRYRKKEIFFLSALADQAALAIENAKLHRELKETGDIYRILTETATIAKFGIFLVQDEEGREGVFHFVNDELCRISGYSKDELLTICHRDLTDPGEYVRSQQKWKKRRGEGKAYLFTRGFLLNKARGKTPIELSYGITTYRGREAFVGFVRDLTAEREREAGFQEFYENASDALFTMDRQGRTIRGNKKVEEITGYTREEFGQTHFAKVVIEEDLERLMAYSKARQEGRTAPEEYEFKLKSKDGKIKDIRMTIRKRAGNEGLVDASMRDVTERKRMEVELSRKLKELDQRTKELSTLLDTSRQVAASIDLDTVLTSIVKLAPKLLQADFSTLRLFNDQKNLLEVVKSHNLAIEFKRPLEIGQSIPGLCFQEGRPIVVDEVLKDPRYLSKDFAEQERTSSLVCVPIRIKDRSIGTLAVACQKVRKFEEPEISLLCGFADQAAIAIHNARLFEKLKESEEKYRTIVESIEDSYFEGDPAGNLTFINDSLCRSIGYSRDELIGKNYRTYMDEENADRVDQVYNRVYTSGEPCRGLLCEAITKDGARKYMEANISLICGQDGGKKGVRGIARDITGHRYLLTRIAKAEESYQKLFETVNDAIFFLNREGYLTTFNHMFVRMFGYPEEEIKSLHFSKFIRPEDVPRMVEDHQKVMRGEPASQLYTFRMINKEGRTIYVEGNFRRMKEGGQITGTLGVLRDMTEKIKLEQELRGLSITDGLTGLYNQRHFYRELEKEMERSKRQGVALSLLLFDLDEFKTYNDTHGHLEGDKVLRNVAQASLKAIRKIDSVYRYGGDEFTVILPGAGEEDGAIVAERVRKSCEELPGLQGISLSIGLVEFNLQYDLPRFIKCADDAMYTAKNLGGDQLSVFSANRGGNGQ